MGFSPSPSSRPLESQHASLCTELPDAIEKTAVEPDPGPHKKATPWGQEMGPRAPIKDQHPDPSVTRLPQLEPRSPEATSPILLAANAEAEGTSHTG